VTKLPGDMRNTQQGPSGQEGGDNFTLQQLMETIHDGIPMSSSLILMVMVAEA